ncbi:MAG TPA: hypothetical protein VG013_20810 [Gemmataceae bacterium]|jgi:hypothetical protein|nr:hypothetical protein [Gemmataceae bacterium]
MRRRWISYAAAFVVLSVAADTFAERPPEEKSKATHVVLGTVAGVYSRDEKDTRYYLVELAIEKVEKGDGFKAGETFYVGCYVRIPDYYKGKKLTEKEQDELAMRGPGYDGVPKEGERVCVYAKHDAVYANGRPGKYSGIYPSWYEVVKGK